VNGNQYALVEFYAPWCSFCKALQIEYLIAAANLKYTYNNNAVMAKVDADSTAGGRALAARFNVTGFPTLIWFVNGKSQTYTGVSLNAVDIQFWVINIIDTYTTTLTVQVIFLFDHFCLCSEALFR
jgi:protein disulfide-isomerase A1